MRQVRQVLGPDALIVSNRSVDGGIEVLATVDGAFDEPPDRRAAAATARVATGASTGHASRALSGADARRHAADGLSGAVAPDRRLPVGLCRVGTAGRRGRGGHDAGVRARRAGARGNSAAAVRRAGADGDAALAPAAPVRMEMPPLQAAPQARAPAMPAVPPVAPQGYARPPAPQQQPMPQQHAAPQPPATPPAYRAAPQAYAQPAAQPAARPPRAHARGSARAATARRADAAGSPAARRAHGAHARCADAAGTGVAAGDLARRHGRRPAERDQRLARRAGKPHGRPALGRPPGAGREPAGAALFRSLLDAGFSTKLVRTLVERMPEGWTPTPRWPGRATNWSRTCRCWARRIRS